MSRLNDLLRQLRMENSALADDLQREFDALADRRSFGLNFERHVPEAVELPGRKVRKGDKVRVLPARGEALTAENDRLWRVTAFATEDGVRRATVVSLDEVEQEASVDVDDLVVVAEFRDPIYPGLVSTGKVERGGDKPFHTVINAENFHALQTLLFTHRGKVDCIYIDPPYNTGAKDWKYNNDYVESDDHYRHSKWLAFMERRLLLAKELLDPGDSVLIVTIDEKEYLRLGLLLEQIFFGARIQMVTSVVNPFGVSRPGALSRVDEYLYYVRIGNAQLCESMAVVQSSAESPNTSSSEAATTYWFSYMRAGSNATRRHSPGCFYPIFVTDEGTLHSVGEALAPDQRPEQITPPQGTSALWPINQHGVQAVWQGDVEHGRKLLANGYVRVGAFNSTLGRRSVTYLRQGTISKIEEGELFLGPHGSIEGTGAQAVAPKTVWNIESHNATSQGTKLLGRMLPRRKFPYPKSLYAVEDTLRLAVSNKPEAVVLDFFAGSGTTAHAIARLNRRDGGARRAIVVTNNEVSADEQVQLTSKKYRPGDTEWERLGIFEHITRPRIEAAITGSTPEGDPIKGDYKFTDEFPMADGFEENVEFFTLTYEAPLRVTSHREFGRISPLLWLRAGSEGRRIDGISDGWDVADVYGVIADLDQSEDFLKAIAANDRLRMAFIVTDEDRLFESLVAELPDHVEPVRLYEAYLRNFEIEAGRGAR